MVKAIVNIDDEADKVIKLLKAQYGLKDKSQAINEMAKQYKSLILDSTIKPEYLLKFESMRKESIIRIGSISDFKKKYGLK